MIFQNPRSLSISGTFSGADGSILRGGRDFMVIKNGTGSYSVFIYRPGFRLSGVEVSTLSAGAVIVELTSMSENSFGMACFVSTTGGNSDPTSVSFTATGMST
jgi:hypothetical protein